jgi:hypothetical protein
MSYRSKNSLVVEDFGCVVVVGGTIKQIKVKRKCTTSYC